MVEFQSIPNSTGIYHDYVLSTRPYAYFTLSGTDGNKDLLGRSTDMTSVTPTNMTTPFYRQSIVPGYEASMVSSGTTTPSKTFGVNGSEGKAFSIDFWTVPASSLAGPFSASKIFNQSNYNFIEINSTGLYVQFTAGREDDTVSMHYQLENQLESKHIGINWSVSSASIFVNGELVDAVSIPDGFWFINSSVEMLFNANSISHIAIYDRSQSIPEFRTKYSYVSKFTSYLSACSRDGGEVFEMFVTPNRYSEIKLSDEIGSNVDFSTNVNKDQHNNFAAPRVDRMQQVGDPIFIDSGGTHLIAGQYLYLNANRYLSRSSWAISIQPLDSGRASDSYLFTISNPSESLEAYVTPSDNLVIKKNEFFTGSSTVTTTFTYDSTIDITRGYRPPIFVMNNGSLTVVTDIDSTIVNTVSGQPTIDINMPITVDTTLMIGTDTTGLLSPVEVLYNLCVTSQLLPDSYLAGDYGSYTILNNQQVAAFWDMKTPAVRNGHALQYLSTLPHIATDQQILSSYIKTEKSHGAGIYTNFTIGGIFLTNGTVYNPVGPSGMPYNSFAGVDFDREIGFENDQVTNMSNADLQVSSIKNANIIMFHDLTVNASNSSSSLTLAGTGSTWITNEHKDTISNDPYSGMYFDFDSARSGPITNPDGYSYRSVEFIAYIDEDHANNGTLVSLYTGSTEYYVGCFGLALDTNMSNVKVNNTAVSSGATIPLNQWIHIYAELPSLVSDHQFYVGGDHAAGNYAAGMGIKAITTYDRVLLASEVDEHYQCFVGRYTGNPNVADSLVVTQSVDPYIYSLIWFTTVVPV